MHARTISLASLLLRVAASVSIVLACAAVACSSSSDGVEPKADGGGHETSAPTPDGGSDGASDAVAPGDAARDSSSRDSSSMDAPSDGPRGLEGGPASLVALSVTASDSSVAVTLTPPFSPEVFDYSVRCAAGTNSLTVAMTASAGADTLLAQPKKSAAAPSQTLDVDVLENQAIVAEAISATTTTQYWIRCLPHDFPQLHVSVHDHAALGPGLFLLGNFQALDGVAGYAIMLDSRGVPVWYYREPSAGYGVVDVDHLRTGDVSFMAAPSDALTGSDFQIHAIAAAQIDTLAETSIDDHELQVLPNGDYLVFAIPDATADLTGLSIPLPDGGVESFGSNSTVVSCDILEVNPTTKAVVWSWSALDHFDPVKDLTYLSPSIVVGPKHAVEAFGCNAIAADADGNLLVSARNMDSVFYVERTTGMVLWKMGGATYNKDGAPYVPVADPFFRQNDARLQPGWSPKCGGSISVFDDETGKTGPARAAIYDIKLPVASDGGFVGCGSDAGPSAALTWQYKGTHSALGSGSFRILTDGSRTIGWGSGVADPKATFTAVDVTGKDLADYQLGSSYTYRAIRIPADAFNLSVLRATAGTSGIASCDGGTEE